MTPSLLSFDPRKKNLGRRGVKIVLTASATEISDFFNNPFIAFVGGFSKGPMPLWLTRKQLYPPVENNHNGTAKYAPYGLRKVEGVLLQNGFDESDIAVVHPYNLDSSLVQIQRLLAYQVWILWEWDTSVKHILH